MATADLQTQESPPEEKRGILTWGEIEESERYQQLNDTQKMRAMEDYMTEVVIPSPEFQSLPGKEREKVIDTFIERKVTPLFEGTSMVGSPRASEREHNEWAVKLAGTLGLEDQVESIVRAPGIRWINRGVTGIASEIEKGFFAGNELAWRAIRRTVDPRRARETPRLDRYVEQSANPQKFGLFTPWWEQEKAKARKQVYQDGLAGGILFDVMDVGTQIGTLGMQMRALRAATGMGKVKEAVSLMDIPTREAQYYKHLGTLGGYRFATTPGGVGERLQSAATISAYNMTPYIANSFGMTGLKAIGTDTALNMFLTSPYYLDFYDKADGDWEEFARTAIPQFATDVGMALFTRGFPETKFEKHMESYLDRGLKLSDIPRETRKKVITDMRDRLGDPGQWYKDGDLGSEVEKSIRRIEPDLHPGATGFRFDELDRNERGNLLTRQKPDPENLPETDRDALPDVRDEASLMRVPDPSRLREGDVVYVKDSEGRYQSAEITEIPQTDNITLQVGKSKKPLITVPGQPHLVGREGFEGEISTRLNRAKAAYGEEARERTFPEATEANWKDRATEALGKETWDGDYYDRQGASEKKKKVQDLGKYDRETGEIYVNETYIDSIGDFDTVRDLLLEKMGFEPRELSDADKEALIPDRETLKQAVFEHEKGHAWLYTLDSVERASLELSRELETMADLQAVKNMGWPELTGVDDIRAENTVRAPLRETYMPREWRDEEDASRSVEKAKYAPKILDQRSLEDYADRVIQDLGLRRDVDVELRQSLKEGVKHEIDGNKLVIKVPERGDLTFDDYYTRWIPDTAERKQQEIEGLVDGLRMPTQTQIKHETIEGLMELDAHRPTPKPTVEDKQRHYSLEREPDTQSIERIMQEGEIRSGEKPSRVEPRDGAPRKPDKIQQQKEDIKHPQDLEMQRADYEEAKRIANSFLRRISIEDQFARVNARDTGRAIKAYHGIIDNMRNRAINFIHKVNDIVDGADRWPSADNRELTVVAAERERLKDLPREQREQYEPILREYDQYMERINKSLQDVGALDKGWPFSRIDHIRNELIPSWERHRASVGSKSAKERASENIRELMEEATFIENMDVRYVPIVRSWLSKLADENPGVFRGFSNRYFKGRKTYKFSELVDRFLEEGVVERESLDLRRIVAEYSDHAGKVVAFNNILRNAEKDGLIQSSKDYPFWAKIPRNFAPRYDPDARIHPVFANYIRDMEMSSLADISSGRLLGPLKMAQFVEFWIMPTYDLIQSSIAGALPLLRPDKLVRNIREADKTFRERPEEYEAAAPLLHSKPFVPSFETFQGAVETALRGAHRMPAPLNRIFGDRFPTRAGWLQTLKNLYQAPEGGVLSKGWAGLEVPLNAVMKPLWYAAWRGDRGIRQVTYEHMRHDRNMSIEDAASTAAKFHADYADVPPRTRKFLNKIFFTPTFTIQVGRLQAHLVKGSINTIRDAVKMEEGDEKDKAMVRGVIGVIAINAALDLGMKSLGFERDLFGYRYKKTVMAENEYGEMEEQELSLTLPNPSSAILREVHRFSQVPQRSDKLNSLVERSKWKIHPLWRTTAQVLQNRDQNFNPIWNPFSSKGKASKDIAEFTLRSLFPITEYFEGAVRQIDEDLPIRDRRGQLHRTRKAFQEEFGTIWGTFLNTATFNWLEASKERQLKSRLNRLRSDFRRFMEHDLRTDEVSEREFQEHMQRLEERIEDLLDEYERTQQ